MANSTSDRVMRKICVMGRGWAFSAIDFSTFGSRSPIVFLERPYFFSRPS